MDPFAQVVHVVEVLTPALVDDLQQQVALERAHQLLAELCLTRVVLPRRVFADELDQLIDVGTHIIERARRQGHRVDRRQGRHQPVQIPVLGVLLGGVVLDRAVEHRGDLLARVLGHVAALEHLVAQRVDDAPLLVHHVVVLEHVLACEEVLLFDLALGLFDLL